MIELFWLGAAIMLVLALALILPALLRRQHMTVADAQSANLRVARERLAELDADLRSGKLDQAGFEQAKRELEAGLLDDLAAESAAATPTVQEGGRWMGVLLSLAVPVLAIGLYSYLGEYAALTTAPTAARQAAASHAAGAENGQQPTVSEMVEKLAARLQSNPEDAEGWFMLGRSYMVMQRYAEAASALERVHALVGDEPNVLVAYADALAMASDGRIAGKPQAMIEKALTLEPHNKVALWLAGMGRAETGEHTAAIAYWQRLLPLIQNDPQSTADVQALITRSQAQGGVAETPSAAPAIAAAPAAESATDASMSAARLQVQVALDAALQDKVDPDDTLFIFARAMQGPPMPLAVARKRAGDLPLTVTLDDSMAMLPAMKLSNFDEVLVGARISKSGNAIPQSGDYSGEVAPVAVNAATAPIQVTIGTRVP